MIVGHGIDLMSTARIAAAIERFGESFLKRVYTEHERQAIAVRGGRRANNGGNGGRGSTAGANDGWTVRAHQAFTAFWAVKEAVMKALGTGNRQGVRFRDIEVRHHPSGRPYVVLYGVSRKRAGALGVNLIHVSMTHLDDLSAASVIFESTAHGQVTHGPGG